jgi:1-acyl-sn-glycerol-3-phosphate acyltransferase
MSAKLRITNWVLRRFFQTICAIDVYELRKIPPRGPLMVVGNHINFLEGPIMMPHLDPRPCTGIAKEESWKNPLFNFLFNLWGLIPIDRGMVDREAFRLSIEALSAGKILAIAPEGTRSQTGQMQPGKPGVVALAARSGAPMMPVGFYGHTNFWHNFKRLRRTPFHIRIGKAFRLKPGVDAMARDVRQVATDEIMYKIAELLPEEYRGYYHAVDQVKYQFIEDLE